MVVSLGDFAPLLSLHRKTLILTAVNKLPPSLRDIPPEELFAEVFARDPHHSGWARGGRRAALEQLSELDPVRYGRERSSPLQYSTRLSPYLRHGVLSLAEVRAEALRQVSPTAPSQAWKLVNELSWRDYFVRVYAQVGDLVWKSFQPYKTGLRADDYVRELPSDIDKGETGMACIDAWANQLVQTGYLHNHVRMWFSSYIVHHRRVAWQTGAGWMMSHFLDGDPAANNLNWQWVASTFRSAPYLWNRDNLQKYVGDTYCATCPLRESGCPFDASYAALTARLFPKRGVAEGETGHLPPPMLKDVPWEPPPVPERAPEDKVVVWVHGDRLSPTNEALVAYPRSHGVFVWDEELLKMWTIRAKRLRFLHECVAELPVHVLRGAVGSEVIRFARHHGATTIATTPSPSPRFREICTELEAAGFKVQRWPEAVFAESVRPLDLRNHTAYWQQIKSSAFGKGAKEPEPKPTKPARRKKKSPDQPRLLDLPPIIPAGLPQDWQDALMKEFRAEYFHELTAFLKQERAEKTIYPPAPDVFNALRLTPLSGMKVLILGQDPYHGKGQANGLSFSVKRGLRIPPSLQNIFRELHADLPDVPVPRHGDLSAWARQGVLLLNAVMTVRAGQPASHAGQGWEEFTDAVIEAVNAKEDRVVFVFWGTYARRKKKLVTGTQHVVIESAHPSPYSAERFFGSKPFSQVNAALEEAEEIPIDWRL